MAQRGKIKVLKEGEGGIIVDMFGAELEFSQPFLAELNLHEGDLVRFERFNINGKVIANNVVRVTIGTILSLNEDGNSGLILEKEHSKNSPQPVAFYQPYLKELGFEVGIWYTMI